MDGWIEGLTGWLGVLFVKDEKQCIWYCPNHAIGEAPRIDFVSASGIRVRVRRVESSSSRYRMLQYPRIPIPAAVTLMYA